MINESDRTAKQSLSLVLGEMGEAETSPYSMLPKEGGIFNSTASPLPVPLNDQ
ncbi:hypothetical protein [Oligella urethralis]|uniref:hypothetical protein n=1 Tax=Oligella urethralis TaxID=90245 RepID=UPI0015ECD12A|nr:hypothetical protein [Oligella urethralis]